MICQYIRNYTVVEHNGQQTRTETNDRAVYFSPPDHSGWALSNLSSLEMLLTLETLMLGISTSMHQLLEVLEETPNEEVAARAAGIGQSFHQDVQTFMARLPLTDI